MCTRFLPGMIRSSLNSPIPVLERLNVKGYSLVLIETRTKRPHVCVFPTEYSPCAPWWQWGYGMGRHKLQAANTNAFYRWEFEWTEIPWQDPEAHSGAIHPPPSPRFIMKMHGPMLQGSVHNFWKLKMSQYFHGLHAHQTYHPLSMFGMLWVDSLFQFPPISSNFAQPLKRSGTTFHRPQSTAWSTLCEGDVTCCMRQMVVTPDTDWFSDLRPYLYFFKCIYDQQICIPSHVKSID